ncbi:entericidin A/B family lipoprotein [Amylibacter sp. IMCC11727]|nr:entericidin A/B family lipoprotein [Amylibacter sp. IMCC11727]WGI23180.1 entericidin A/B family lipoprotein [Amylibacter sp. IMCC11727]
MKRAILLIGAALALGACETVDGLGQDIENTGEAIQKTVNG